VELWKSVTGTTRNLYLVIANYIVFQLSNCNYNLTIIITTSLVYILKKEINNQITNYYYYNRLLLLLLLQQITNYYYYNITGMHTKKKKSTTKAWVETYCSFIYITISPKSKNLTLIHLIVILILYPYDVKLMSMSLRLFVNFCQSSSIWFVQFFVSFLSVYIYIVHYLCLISPHGLAALAGDIKIDWLIDWYALLLLICCPTFLGSCFPLLLPALGLFDIGQHPASRFQFVILFTTLVSLTVATITTAQYLRLDKASAAT